MRVLIFGSREWTDPEPIKKALEALREDEKSRDATIVHGDARGADTIGGLLAEDLGFKVEKHPAYWYRYGLAAGPIRNKAMIESGIDLALGFGTSGKGSQDMIRRLQEAGINFSVVNTGGKSG